MTVLKIIQRGMEFLERKGIESPRLQTELLLAHALNIPRLNLYLDFERTLTLEQLDLARSFLKRRANHEPLQHIVGTTSFCGLEIKVTPDVLIPRSETEMLAEKACQFLKSRTQTCRAKALDFGTGTGCLAIVLACQCPGVFVAALDVSRDALEVARKNSALHKVTHRIEFFSGDGFSSLPEEKGKFDLIVSNPPYIPTCEICLLASEVRDYDPKIALDGGADGLKFFTHLASRATAFLAWDGRIMVEFGDGQEAAIRKIFETHRWMVESIDHDCNGKPRILVAKTETQDS